MPKPAPIIYTNPVYPRDFPDPFVLRHGGIYYAYGTGISDDQRRFPILSSRNLVDWEPHGGALEPLDQPGLEEYWAPEVAYREGRFSMYYSTGQTENPDHHMRLAVADHPLGPWEDAGVDLTPHEIFAIDGHPFQDPADGQWYLFYARDELEAPFAGTGIVVDRLIAMDRLEGKPRPVLRPYAEWQVFELQRAVKQGLDWYTIEGPFVLRVDGRYVCFYSGGRYENPNYGVGYAHADHPLGPWVDDSNREAPLILRTIPNHVLGPGHNSVVIGPDLVSQYIVYHGWDLEGTGRYPRIDPLLWDGWRPKCDGASSDARPAPRMPDLIAWFGEEGSCAGLALPPGCEQTSDGVRVSERGPLTLGEPVENFVLETAASVEHPDAEWGVGLGDCEVRVGRGVLRIGGQEAPLPADFRPEALHHLRVRRTGSELVATLEAFPTLTARISPDPAVPALSASAGAVFSHVALTRTE